MMICAFLFTCVAGWLVICPWLRRRPALSLATAIGLSFAAGAAALSLELLLLNLARIPWTRFSVLSPWIAAAAAHTFFGRRLWAPPMPRLRRPCLPEIAALAFSGIVLSAWVPYERLLPLNEWDAIMLWMFKGKAFYLDGSIAPYMSRAHEFLGNPAYPLLVPLYATFLYICSGSAADQLAKLLSPCLFGSLAAGFYYFLRRYGSRSVAAIFTSMLAGLYMVDVAAFRYAGYADTAVAAAILPGAGFLYAWFREGDYADFALAVFFASIAAWTKNEGQFFLAGLGGLAVARLLWQRIWDRRYWFTLAAGPVLFVAPWVAARNVYGVKRPGELSGEMMRTNIASYGPTVKAIFDHAFTPAPPDALGSRIWLFNLTFPLCVLAVFLYRRAGLDQRFWVLPALACWQLFGVSLVYVTGPVNLQWMIGSSLDRVLSQIAPIALLAGALVFASYYNAAEARLGIPVTGEASPRNRERVPASSKKQRGKSRA